MLPTLNNRTAFDGILAVSLTEAARQCHLTSDDLSDNDVSAMLTSCIMAAQSYLEGKYIVVFGQASYSALYDSETADVDFKRLHLPVSPVLSIDSIKIGNTTIPSESYVLYSGSYRNYIELNTYVLRGQKALVNYKAGYATQADVPVAVKQAVLMLTAHYYDVRNPQTDKAVNISAYAIDALMTPYKSSL